MAKRKRKQSDSNPQYRVISSDELGAAICTCEIKIVSAPSILERCLAKKPFSALDVWNGTPIDVRHWSALSFDLVLGGRFSDGFNLIGDEAGFRPVFENAFAAARLLDAEGLFVQALRTLGMPSNEFLEKVGDLELANADGKALLAGFRDNYPDVSY